MLIAPFSLTRILKTALATCFSFKSLFSSRNCSSCCSIDILVLSILLFLMLYVVACADLKSAFTYHSTTLLLLNNLEMRCMAQILFARWPHFVPPSLRQTSPCGSFGRLVLLAAGGPRMGRAAAQPKGMCAQRLLYLLSQVNYPVLKGGVFSLLRIKMS